MKAQEKIRALVQAAGGIVMRDAPTPLVAIVRLRKDKSWVLPKGKLKPGEDALAAAKREVLEETGHEVSVHEFLGSMSHADGGKIKIVQFWRMRSVGAPVHELMRDVTAVRWLPLQQAIEALTHEHERAFLSNVGPIAIEAAERSARDASVAPARDPSNQALRQPVGDDASGLAARNTLFETIRAWVRRITR